MIKNRYQKTNIIFADDKSKKYLDQNVAFTNNLITSISTKDYAINKLYND